MIRFKPFRLRYHSFRVSQFRELKDLRDLPELPSESYLHILDNFQNPLGQGKVNFCPALDNPLININKYKLLMVNVGSPVEGVAPIVTNKMIITNAGLAGRFMDYRRDMMPRVIYYSDIKDLPFRSSAQRLISYNSLWRTRVVGVRRKPRFMNMILATLVNEIMKAPDGMHYIHIPLEGLMFERRDFMKVFRKYDRIATKYPECSSYLFLAHLYGILMKQVQLPPRGITAEEDEENRAEDGETSTESFVEDEFLSCESKDFFTNILNYMTSDPESAMEVLKIKDSENPYTHSIFEYLPPRMYEHINFILTCGGQYIIYNLRDLKELNGRSGAGLIRIVNHINLLTACGRPGDKEALLTEEPMVAEDVVEVDQTCQSANQPEFKQPMTKTEKEDAIDQDLSELDDVDKILAETALAPDKPFTQAQKEHVAVISHTYKELTIGGKTFDQVLREIPDVEMEIPEVEVGATKDGSVNQTITQSTTSVIDANYVQKKFDQDLAAIVTSFNKQGMFLVDFKEEEVVDELNAKKVYVAKYEDVNHKKHTFKFTLPKLDEFGRFKDNGSYKAIDKQRVNNPIVKSSASRVLLNSNYNKLLVERNENVAHSFMNWFMTALKKAEVAGFKMMLVHGSCKYPVKAFPFELTEIGARYTRINFVNGNLIFDIAHRDAQVPNEYRNQIIETEKEYGIWFGHKGDDQFYITVSGAVAVKNAKTNEEVFYGAFLDFFEWLLGIQLNAMVEYTDLAVLGKKVPLVHALCYRYGLTEMLKYTGCDYEVFDINQRFEKKTSDIVIKFSDKKLVIRRMPRNNALLFGGLTIYDFSEVALEDMDGKDVYYEMLSQKKVSTNLIKGLDPLFDLFIDPITKDVLREMKEPTDLRDLLLRANTMLTTSDHKPEASASNFRFRGVEQITGIVYNEMARAFANYQNHSGGQIRFSISEYQIKQRIAKEQLVENVSIINPLNDIKQYSKFSNSGSGGRSNETFTIPDRQFTQDQIGVVSEATVDNGKTGLNASLPFNPVIINGRGMCADEIDWTKLEPENVLSITALLYPCLTHDDGKRAGFAHIQASHYVPIAESDVSRVRTGFEEVIAQRCSEPCFAYSAKDDGVIESINEKSKTMIIRYKDGKKICLNYGDQATNNSANGFYVNQEVTINNFKPGDKFRRGDILTYNRQFFQADPYSKQVRWKMGILAKVAIFDNGGTVEDAAILTQPLCNRMVFSPIYVKDIVLTIDTNVHAYASIGTHVASTDPLIVFDQSAVSFGEDDDPELIRMLSDMNKSAPKAEHAGEVIRIDALYKSPISAMSPTMQKLVKTVIELKNEKAAAAEGCTNSDEFLKSTPLVATNKVGITDLNKDTIILRFYIRHPNAMSPGDKLFFDSSLKSVCSTVYPDYIETEDGDKVEACTSARGVLARLITSPFLYGLSNSVLEKLENDMLDVWQGREPVNQLTRKK